ncbi:MAG: DUF3631 domain-containing protein [Verrucomicrobia bacterium]|nr:DUF3631 domain-containing protein [Deltaproteobacteria bacterium]
MDISIIQDRLVGFGSETSTEGSVELIAKSKYIYDDNTQGLRVESLLWCANVWSKAMDATDTHPLLVQSGLKSHGLKCQGDILLIPMYDVSGTVHGIQFIGPNGINNITTGANKTGFFFPISDPSEGVVVITANFSTAAIIHETTGLCVLVAFEVGNILPVAEVIRGNCPGYRIFTTLSTDINDFHELERHDRGQQLIEDATLVMAVTPCDGHGYDAVTCKSAQIVDCDVVTDNTGITGARREELPDGGIDLVDVVPCKDPVDPVLLLNDIASIIKRFVICSDNVLFAVTLWIAMTWFSDVLQVAPLALVTAPEKRCGKSLLLSLIGRLSFRPLTASNITSAALFRVLEAWKPTLLLDEADTFMKRNEELRGVINCGHTRDSAYIIRIVGEKPTRFGVWGPKAIAGIGKLADTLMDRSIVMEVRRKLPNESTERLRYADPEIFESVVSKLARFANDNKERVRSSRPYLPETLNDRAQDNWEPLLAIADIAGGEWPDRARHAALAISGGSSPIHSIGTELLSDIQVIFSAKKIDRIFSKDLIKELCVDDERRWATFNRGRSISPRQVSSQIHEYGIVSRSIRIGPETAKGFFAVQFEEAFRRYLPPLGGN